MTIAIDVARDQEGLRMAALALLEEGFVRSRIKGSLQTATDENADRIFNSIPKRTLAEGYYARAQFLLGFEEYVDAGLPLSTVSMIEADGLIAVKRARREFEYQHPSCGACGALQEGRFNTSCDSCGVKFKGRGD
jgi:hypothetical protein